MKFFKEQIIVFILAVLLILVGVFKDMILQEQILVINSHSISGTCSELPNSCNSINDSIYFGVSFDVSNFRRTLISKKRIAFDFNPDSVHLLCAYFESDIIAGLDSSKLSIDCDNLYYDIGFLKKNQPVKFIVITTCTVNMDSIIINERIPYCKVKYNGEIINGNHKSYLWNIILIVAGIFVIMCWYLKFKRRKNLRDSAYTDMTVNNNQNRKEEDNYKSEDVNNGCVDDDLKKFIENSTKNL